MRTDSGNFGSVTIAVARNYVRILEQTLKRVRIPPRPTQYMTIFLTF